LKIRESSSQFNEQEINPGDFPSTIYRRVKLRCRGGQKRRRVLFQIEERKCGTKGIEKWIEGKKGAFSR
jgi:hypothetical protein